MTVLFHGSFGLNREYMASLIATALKNPHFKDKDLAKQFGYGGPFAAKYRSWLHKTGLAEVRLPIRLTRMGEVVIKKDPKLESRATQWFLHHELATDPERAEAWHYFAHIFLPRHSSFTRDELVDGLTEILRTHSEQHFGPGSQLTKLIARKILECYTTDYGLGALGLLSVRGEQYIRGKPKKVLGPWESPESLNRAY